jgi:hypothetical protein
VLETLLLSGKYAESESVAKKARDMTNDQSYKVISDYLIVCSLYLRGLTDAGRQAALELLNYCESNIIDHDSNWSFEELRKTIYRSSLVEGSKTILISLRDTVKNYITRQVQTNEQVSS